MDNGDVLEQRIENSELFHADYFELICKKFKSDNFLFLEINQ